MAVPPPGASGQSLVKTAIDAVKAHIRDAGLKVGDALPGEGVFAEQLGVSRAVMRSCTRILPRVVSRSTLRALRSSRACRCLAWSSSARRR